MTAGPGIAPARRVGPRGLGAAVAVLLGLAAPPAAGEDRSAAGAAPASDKVIGLLDVRVEGVSPAAAAVFTKQIEESLEISGKQVAPRESLSNYLAGTPWNSACLIGACLRELRLRAAVGQVIEVALVSTGPSYHYVITLLDTESGRTVNQIAAKCDVCTTEEAFAAAALAVVELVNGVGDASPDPAATIAPVAPGATARVRAARRRARALGISLIGVGAVAAAASYYFFDQDRGQLGAAAAGGAGAVGVAGLLSIGVSFSF